MKYKYIAPTNISVPYTLIEEVRALVTTHGLQPLPAVSSLCRQVNTLIRSNDIIDFPLHLSDYWNTYTLTESVFNSLKSQRVRANNVLGITESALVPYKSEELTQDLALRIVRSLPDKLQKLRPRIVLQVVKDGLPPHIDFARTATLFYLIDGDDSWVTTWYRLLGDVSPLTESTKYGFFWVHGDIDRMIAEKSIQLKKDIWYLFDSASYHSIHCCDNIAKDQPRVALNIEFNSITAEEIYNLIESDIF